MAETPPVPEEREPEKRSYPRREVIAIAGFGGLALLRVAGHPNARRRLRLGWRRPRRPPVGRRRRQAPERRAGT